MNILASLTEDIDWPIFGAATVVTGAGRAYSRCQIRQPSLGTGAARSAPFAGGAVTSAWLSTQFAYSQAGSSLGVLLFGFCLSGTNNLLGICTDVTTNNKLVLCKYNGTTKTVLAVEGSTSLPSGTNRYDLQVSSYGASATVILYVNGSQVLTFTGDVTVSGMTNFDAVFLAAYTALSGFGNAGAASTFTYSETFVADSDTRAVLGVQSEALTGAGTTNAWTNNTFTNINGTSFSDANPAYANTAAQDQQYTVTTPTPTIYSVIAVAISARLARPATAMTTQVKLGYKNGAGGSFGTGSTKTPSVGYSTFQQIDGINPVTGVAFTSSDLASLQLCIESA